MSASTGLTLATEVERHQQGGLAMKEEFCFYVGVDWGVEFHQACILDANGEKICQRRIEHSGPGMLEFCDFLPALTHGEASALAVAIEVPRGPIVEALLEHNYAVFSIHPKQLDRFRDRHTVAGAKDDRRDALVAADCLRTDQHCFRRVRISFACANSPGRKRLLAST
jgi:hypothetical protein